MPAIGVSLIAHNEERQIAASLASVHWADQVVVVDCASADHTADEVRKFPRVRMFARNFSKKGGTRPPSPREVNSRGSSPAVGRFAPSGLPSLFPRLIEIIPGPFLKVSYEFSGLKSKSLKCRSDQRYARFSIIGM